MRISHSIHYFILFALVSCSPKESQVIVDAMPPGADAIADSPMSSPDAKGDSSGPIVPPCTDCTPPGELTYVLPSPSNATLWTTSTMQKVLREAAPPTLLKPEIVLSAAKNEYEPFQIVVRAQAAGTASLTMSDLIGPGGAKIAASEVDVRRVAYVNIAQPSDGLSIKSTTVPDPLEPSSFAQAESVPAGQNQPFWLTVRISENTPAGDYTATLTVQVNGQSQAIPVKLHVFNFALPKKIGFDGNWNTSFEALGGGESLEKTQFLKDFFYAHRLVPSSVAWPAGLNYTGGIEYNCAQNQFVNKTGSYEFSSLGPKYIDGKGWNDIGFPSFQIMQFVNNSTPRPQVFCGVDRGPDHYGTAAYNAKWSLLLTAIESQLKANNWQSKGYYYVQNEPQNSADHKLAAYLANLTKAAAPSLRIAISEEPKAEIAEAPEAQGHSYDLWWADLSHFEPNYAKVRQNKGEHVWWYFLYGDLPPHFNPITIDHEGVESRIAFWAAFKYRIRGFAYYSLTQWGDNPYTNPRPAKTNQNGDGFLFYPPKNGKLVSSIRLELLREGIEDYEYLLLSAGGNLPLTSDTQSGCDSSVHGAVSSTKSFTRDAAALKNLRDELGSYLEKKRNGCPVFQSNAQSAHKRAPYYINFQNPSGDPKASPLVIDGHEWLKIGWSAYDAKLGYGWSGPEIGKSNIMLYQYLSSAPVNELQRSLIYNDYGRTDTFNWDIENGKYRVTVSIGWHGRGYAKQRVIVEGQPLFDNTATTTAAPYQVKSTEITVTDGNVTMEVGQKDEYTMLNWMSIEPVP